MMSDLLPEAYTGLLHEIKARIQKAQYEALKAVNKELIALYWGYWAADCGAAAERFLGQSGRGNSCPRPAGGFSGDTGLFSP
jgi:hypothetical protein